MRGLDGHQTSPGRGQPRRRGDRNPGAPQEQANQRHPRCAGRRGGAVPPFRDGAQDLDTFRPDLILLDLNLPKVSGFDVLDRIKTSDELSSTPVIVLTVSERDEDIARAYQLGANTYITKPVDFAKFMHAIDTLWEYWMVIAKLPVQAGVGGREEECRCQGRSIPQIAPY